MSKDVIHDFYLPNFRAQLYAVPGMVGRITFTPTTTTAELEQASRRTVPVDAGAGRTTWSTSTTDPARGQPGQNTAGGTSTT